MAEGSRLPRAPSSTAKAVAATPSNVRWTSFSNAKAVTSNTSSLSGLATAHKQKQEEQRGKSSHTPVNHPLRARQILRFLDEARAPANLHLHRRFARQALLEIDPDLDLIRKLACSAEETPGEETWREDWEAKTGTLSGYIKTWVKKWLPEVKGQEDGDAEKEHRSDSQEEPGRLRDGSTKKPDKIKADAYGSSRSEPEAPPTPPPRPQLPTGPPESVDTAVINSPPPVPGSLSSQSSPIQQAHDGGRTGEGGDNRDNGSGNGLWDPSGPISFAPHRPQEAKVGGILSERAPPQARDFSDYTSYSEAAARYQNANKVDGGEFARDAAPRDPPDSRIDLGWYAWYRRQKGRDNRLSHAGGG